MYLTSLFKKAITGGEWSVAYRRTNQEEYSITQMPSMQWGADPFVIETGNRHYIFVEQYDRKKRKGCIGYFSFEDGIPVNKGIIIENNYHMSYPDVFVYNNNFYMIPESSANSTVDLYVAEHFPDKWKKVKSLISGRKYVDSTVYCDGSNYYLISYSMVGGYEIHIFSLDMEKQELKFLSKKRYKKNVARPGGWLFIVDGKLMRPAQDCSQKYGESLILYQIDNMNNNGVFVEHEVNRIDAENLKIQGGFDRVHQITSDGTYEVIDVYKERIDLFHFIKIYIRSRRH